MSQELTPLSEEEVVGGLDSNLGWAVVPDGSMHFIGVDMGAAPELERFMSLVLSSRQLPFITSKGGQRCPAKKASPLANFLTKLPYLVSVYSPEFDYSPSWQLFFDCYRKHPIRELCATRNPNELLLCGKQSFADVFNEFVQFLRDEARETNLGKRLSDRKRNSTKNAGRLATYIKGLFDRYTRLCVVRIDLHLNASGKSDLAKLGPEIAAHGNMVAMGQSRIYRGFDEVAPRSSEDPRHSPALAMQMMAKFVKQFRRDPAFIHMVGYVRKTEWAPFAGFHHHMAFFFNESEVQSDFYRGQLIGECWKRTVTDGYFFNCNADKRRYREVGIGKIEAHDHQKRQLLYKALSYLVKAEQYATVKHICRGRMFQTGVLKAPIGKKRGRPRKVQAMVFE